MEEQDKILHEVASKEYEYGFTTDLEMDVIPKGLSEEVVRMISAKKNEPEFMLNFRLNAYRRWLEMEMPDWAYLKIPPIDFQDIIYYAAPKKKVQYESLDEVDPELLETFKKLGVPLEEQKVLAGVAVDAVIDSVSVKTT
ncbi:MAG: Fe-S cluster assembly protein SufB, partial [Mangrovibacterium sp.]